MPLDAVLDRPEPVTSVAPTQRAVSYRILVADDQREIIEAVRLMLNGHEFTLAPAASPAAALSLAGGQPFDAALVDLNYERGRTTGEQGLELITALHSLAPEMPIIVMTAWSSIDLALEAMRRGARDFIEKPWDETRLVTMLRSQAELGCALRRVTELERENHDLKASGTTSDNGVPHLNTMRLNEVEGLLVRHAMEEHHGNVSRAARTLGLSRSALYRRLERHKI